MEKPCLENRQTATIKNSNKEHVNGSQPNYAVTSHMWSNWIECLEKLARRVCSNQKLTQNQVRSKQSGSWQCPPVLGHPPHHGLGSKPESIPTLCCAATSPPASKCSAKHLSSHPWRSWVAYCKVLLNVQNALLFRKYSVLLMENKDLFNIFLPLFWSISYNSV